MDEVVFDGSIWTIFSTLGLALSLDTKKCTFLKVYKTGDRMRLNEDGELVYLCHFGCQVKICGYRIELGEIEILNER